MTIAVRYASKEEYS